MSEEQSQPTMYDLANEFINLANELVETDNSGNVGVALRYAGARYSAFEATAHSQDLANEKEEIIKMYLEDYRKMLSDNIDDYLKAQMN